MVEHHVTKQELHKQGLRSWMHPGYFIVGQFNFDSLSQS
jgi:hypothetical protein